MNHDERVYHHLYVESKSPLENAECIASLEELVEELQYENAKLRDLACTFVYCMQVHNDCDGCRLNGSKGELSYDPLLACDGLHELMRELGVEVNDG